MDSLHQPRPAKRAFVAHKGAVHWAPNDHTLIPLADRQVEGLFHLFCVENEPGLFDELDRANVAAGGIPRVSPFRRRKAA